MWQLQAHDGRLLHAYVQHIAYDHSLATVFVEEMGERCACFTSSIVLFTLSLILFGNRILIRLSNFLCILYLFILLYCTVVSCCRINVPVASLKLFRKEIR